MMTGTVEVCLNLGCVVWERKGNRALSEGMSKAQGKDDCDTGHLHFTILVCIRQPDDVA
jgi:hypothetical protein